MRWLALPLALACFTQAQAAETWSALDAGPFEGWHSELLFNTDRYFQDGDRGRDRQITANLIDVTIYQGRGYQEPALAFAVEMVCPAGAVAPDKRESCRPVLRMVSPRSGKDHDWSTPKTRGALAKRLIAAFEWREADLRSCPAAMDRLLSFTGVSSALWPDGYLAWLKGEEPQPAGDIIVIHADGPTVSLRARAQTHPLETDAMQGLAGYFARQSSGPAYRWAFAMRDVVEPCLKPGTAVTPWERALAQPDAPRQRSLEF